MLAEKRTAAEFLKKHNVYVEDIDFQKCVETFLLEMSKGLSDKSSLPMLPTYLSLDNISVNNEKVIVIDAGGTNFRVALVSFNENGKCKIESFSKHRMPGTSGEIDADTFFKQMAALVMPVINESDKIGFCFSYALEMTNSKDGKILFFSKELKVKGAEGMLVGKNLLDALGTPEKKIVLLNDTVAALLAGVANYPDRKFGSFSGFILGTGTNTAYIESRSNIKKSDEISSELGNMIINMESGDYDKITPGYIDELVTNATKNPDRYRFEKMISGAYLGMNLYTTLKTASFEGLFSKGFSDELERCEKIDSAEIDSFFEHPYGEGKIQALCQNESERKLVYFFAEHVIERAAKLAAISLAAVVKKSGAGENPLEPVCIIAEGTTFYREKYLKNMVLYYIRKHLNKEMNIFAELLHVEDATLVGSAMAGLIE